MTVTIECPVEDCGSEMEVELDYEPAEHGYGRDADGNRGIYVPGYFYAGDIPNCCPEGHVFTTVQMEAMRKDADDKASTVEYEPEYTGPDKWDEDD